MVTLMCIQGYNIETPDIWAAVSYQFLAEITDYIQCLVGLFSTHTVPQLDNWPTGLFQWVSSCHLSDLAENPTY